MDKLGVVADTLIAHSTHMVSSTCLIEDGDQ